MKDLIYRQSAINALENTECELLAEEWNELTNAIKQVPSAEKDNDMIHLQKEQAYLQGWEEGREALRRSAIYAVEKESQVDGAYGYMDTKSIVDLLSDLPSAQPEAKPPKWVAEDRYVKNHFKVFPHCPQCNAEVKTEQCYCMICGQHIDWSEDDE